MAHVVRQAALVPHDHSPSYERIGQGDFNVLCILVVYLYLDLTMYVGTNF